MSAADPSDYVACSHGDNPKTCHRCRGWGVTEDERRRLMAGEMPDIERRRMLARLREHWTTARIAEALEERASASGMSLLEYLRRPLQLQ